MEPKQSAIFLRKDTCDQFDDGGVALRVAISTVFQRTYPDGDKLFWRSLDGGWELVSE